MKRIIYISLALLLLSCTGLVDKDSLYLDDIQEVAVSVTYPSGYESFQRAGVTVKAENIGTGYSYKALTNESGVAVLKLLNGLYRITVVDKAEEGIFNATADNVRVAGADVSLPVSLLYSKSGELVIKELYHSGCKKLPIEGDYSYDKYAIIHNNSPQTIYLDSLCVGTLSPYNSTSTNPWVTTDSETGETIFPDFVPVIQCVWQFGGDGSTFPLAPGEDAVIAFNGAIDHTVTYPLSVNLNNEEYFVCYNNTYFPNTSYHPAPGDRIRQDHILNVVIKTGQANAYPLSVSSPALVIFRAEGMSIQDFILQEDAVVQIPGSSVDQVVCVPEEWVIDGMEVFDSRSTSNKKRLSPVIDAGYISLADVYIGNSYVRKVDEELSAVAGYEVLMDTNNTTVDFELSTNATLYRPADE